MGWAKKTWGIARDLVKRVLVEQGRNAPDRFYVVQKQTLRQATEEWSTLFPKVKPYYAVKCNPDAGILRTFAERGLNFDCASPFEIDRVISVGVHPSRILYANPCSQIPHSSLFSQSECRCVLNLCALLSARLPVVVLPC